MTIDTPLGTSVRTATTHNLLTGPILRTLVTLAVPNTVALLGSALIAVAETSYIGRLGTVPLAAIALVFPLTMLVQTMSAGAMGGGVSSAISRAIGAGDQARAATLAIHAAIIGLCGGLLFTAGILIFGSALYELLGGRGVVLSEAVKYSDVLFLAAIPIWLVNTLASILRGTGDMTRPSVTIILSAIAQIIVGGVFGLGFNFGIGAVPSFGMRGVAMGQLVAFTGGTLFLGWYLLSGRSRLDLRFAGMALRKDMFLDILKVGAVSCLSPLQTVLTILIFTKILASFGTQTLAGYGIGSRLEFLLIPIAFAIGVASVPMIGMAIGAGLVDRARRVAWTAAALSGGLIGLIGVVAATMPQLWVSLFTSDPGVAEAAASYFHWAGPAYGFFGFGVCLFFCSQGAAKVLGPILAGTTRLLIVLIGGIWLVSSGAPAWTLYALVMISLVAFGLATAVSVKLSRWGI
jgi:putative MATE family efflux protein